MITNAKEITYYRKVQMQRLEKGRGLGFTDAQLEFIIETASMMAQIMVMTPPTDETGQPVRIVPE
jgi:hypothetical protein